MSGGQLAVLNALDVAKTQWYHYTTIVIAGMGFFTDAYDLFCISLVTTLLGRLYYTDLTKPKPGVLPPNVQAAVTGVALCGTLAGQLFFGWLGDKLGRKKVYGITLLLMVVCSIASGRGSLLERPPRLSYPHFVSSGSGLALGLVVTTLYQLQSCLNMPTKRLEGHSLLQCLPCRDLESWLVE